MYCFCKFKGLFSKLQVYISAIEQAHTIRKTRHDISNCPVQSQRVGGHAICVREKPCQVILTRLMFLLLLLLLLFSSRNTLQSEQLNLTHFQELEMEIEQTSPY